jgi:hypothetical protein
MVLAASACGSPLVGSGQLVLFGELRRVRIPADLWRSGLTDRGIIARFGVEAIVVFVPLPTVCTFAPVVARGLAARRPSHNSVMITA